MTKFLAPVLVALPLLGAVGTQAATAAPNAALSFSESQAPLVGQAEGGAIVNVAEGCGTGYFRDGNGTCLYYGYGAPAAPPHEACPPDRHFQRWSNHAGGRCLVNRY